MIPISPEHIEAAMADLEVEAKALDELVAEHQQRRAQVIAELVTAIPRIPQERLAEIGVVYEPPAEHAGSVAIAMIVEHDARNRQVANLGKEVLPSNLTDAIALLQSVEAGLHHGTRQQQREAAARYQALRKHVFQLQQGAIAPLANTNDVRAADAAAVERMLARL